MDNTSFEDNRIIKLQPLDKPKLTKAPKTIKRDKPISEKHSKALAQTRLNRSIYLKKMKLEKRLVDNAKTLSEYIVDNKTDLDEIMELIGKIGAMRGVGNVIVEASDEDCECEEKNPHQ